MYVMSGKEGIAGFVLDIVSTCVYHLSWWATHVVSRTTPVS
jgi:hypothetical protein